MKFRNTKYNCANSNATCTQVTIHQHNWVENSFDLALVFSLSKYMNNWLPSLNSLRAFEVVSRHLNYHSAARELNVTPGAVKQLVSKLEASVGGRLLERKGQGLQLTKKGADSCNELARAFSLMASSVEKMRAIEKQQQLIITVEASFATAWLVQKLEAFRECHPNINVLIDSSQHVVDLDSSDADVAIRYGVENSSNLYVHRLFDDRIFPVCSPSLVSGRNALEKLEGLQQMPLIHWDITELDWAHSTRRWFTWERWLERVEVSGIDTDKGLFYNDYGLAVQAAVAGQGVVLASWPILRDPIDRGLLVRPFSEEVITDIGYDLATTFEKKTRPEVHAFVDWIVETANQENERPFSSREG